MAKVQDRVYIAEGDRELYDRLEREWILKGTTRREQFLLAMAVGFRNELQQTFTKRDEFFLVKDLRPEDDAILDAIAISATSGSVETLCDRAAVFKIAQGFAHGGIRLLVDEFESAPLGSYDKKFEKDLLELASTLGSPSHRQTR